MTSVLLVEKNGTIKSLKIKEFCEEDFYKKCGYKSPSNFKKQHTWKGKVEGTTYYISLFAKTDSRTAMGENKYEFPPPVDSVLYFGTCLLAGYKNETEPINLTIEMWNAVYNKLYGGFENLKDTAEKDEMEKDELDSIPSHRKTKEGYLKDGFVVDEKVKKIPSSSKKSASSSTATSSATSASSHISNSELSGSAKKKEITQPLSDEENEISEEDEEEDDDDSSTVYSDIDEEDYEDSPSTKKGSKKKKDLCGGGGGGSSKKKDLAQKERDDVSLEIAVSEFIITDELEEEDYIE